MLKQKYAFTLAEVLMGLLVVCILIAAMAPIITKRFSDRLRINADSISGNSAMLVYDTTNGIWHPKGLALDSFKQTAPGEIEFTNKEGNPVELKLTLQGAGGGGGGHQRTGDLYANSSAKQAVASTVDNTYDWEVPYGVSNVRLTIAGGGGGGGAAKAGEGGEEYLIPKAINGGVEDLCIKKYNVGDIPSLLPAGVNMGGTRDLSSYPVNQRGGILPATQLRDVTSSGPFDSAPAVANSCWHAKNYSTAAFCRNYTGYSGCYRTLCTQEAATNACAALPGGWRLPTTAEIKRWRTAPESNSVYTDKAVLTTNSADFCTDSYTNGTYGAVNCDYNQYACLGTGVVMGHHCFPSNYWSSVPSGYYSLNMNELRGPFVSSVNTEAYSARCVRSTSECGFTPLHGAGGSAGATLTNITFSNLQQGDRLRFTLGAGGTGAVVNGANAENGGNTIVVHQREIIKGNNIWQNVSASTTYTAGGGGAGGSATTTTHGNKGTGGSCSISQGCTAGVAASDWTSNTSTAGGASTLGAGALTSDATTFNGRQASYYGAGGAGGFAKDASSIGKGGQGGAGYAIVTYNIASTGSGGGAGGYHYSNVRVSVPHNKTVQFTIGKGGEGSTTDTGISGTDTKVEQDSVLLFRAAGGLGGTFTPIIYSLVKSEQEANLAKGGEGGKIYNKTDEVVNAQILIDTSGAKADFVKGGNGGVSKSDNRPPAYGGCAAVDNPTSFSLCSGNATATPALTPLYDKVKGTAKGGGGGGGAGCDDTACYAGSNGAGGFITVRW